MNFHNFQALVASLKSPINMSKPTPSFCVAPERNRPYIEPNFAKILFAVERPQVILVSAVGATGKSALAQVLSARLNLPLLDLGKHKPVGDNTLTGLLHGAFSMELLSPVFQGLASGSYGVIIDGIDEGRSKTHEQAFNAFLDDVAKLSEGSPATSFVLLGRTNVVEDCWAHLTDKGLTTGVVQIEPFDLKQAQDYIDLFTVGARSGQKAQYEAARDAILGKLSTAFTQKSSDEPSGFLSFIGYPPVLDAIVTLLCEERNYHRLKERLEDGATKNVETELLYKIASYILDREANEKVIPNFVTPLLRELDQPLNGDEADKEIFGAQEQCMRLVAHCIGQPISLHRLHDPVLDARYEEQLANFLPEHPFLAGKEFRNAVFEAVALALLISSPGGADHELALRYFDMHRHSYYLIYLLDIIAPERQIPLSCLRTLIGAAMEFKANNTSVDMQIMGPDPDDPQSGGSVHVQVELSFGVDGDPSKVFEFQCPWSNTVSVDIGNRLSSAYVVLPGDVVLSGREIELTAPIELRAGRLHLRSETLTLRSQGTPGSASHVLLEADSVVSEVKVLAGAGVDLTFALESPAGLHYPLARHAVQKSRLPDDPELQEKYLRLRKILTHFRSHSKGSLAKYRHKIENPRVAGNRVGSAILSRLLEDGVLFVEGPLYFLDPGRIDALLGISWTDLRNGLAGEKLVGYLRAIRL